MEEETTTLFRCESCRRLRSTELASKTKTKTKRNTVTFNSKRKYNESRLYYVYNINEQNGLELILLYTWKWIIRKKRRTNKYFAINKSCDYTRMENERDHVKYYLER